MKVTPLNDDHVKLEIDLPEAGKLYRILNQHTEALTSGAIELASLLQTACYEATDTFRQPPHAFDEIHPSHPITEA